MFVVLITILIGIGFTYLAERLWLNNKIHSEASRKLIHITYGVLVSIWPFFVSMRVVLLLQMMFLALVVLDKKYHFIQGAKEVTRSTWGEFWYPIGLIVLALMNPSAWVFMAAALHLAVADAVAAMVGTSRLGKHKYKVFGHTKSVEGSASFWLVSVLVTGWVIYLAPSGIDRAIGLPLIIFVATVATALENIGVYGTDNLLVPTFVALVLMSVV